ncbi:MAG: M28 family peptidase [Bacteroidota bacterium]
MKRNQIIAFSLLAILVLWIFSSSILKSCTKLGFNSEDQSNNSVAESTTVLQKAPVFLEDSAYLFIEKQVAFGPRVPATPQHKACGDWLKQKLTEYGAKVYTQDFVGTAYDGKKRNSRNIIGSLNPTATTRIMLAAHWDTRPMADQDDNDQSKPILGAIDGGSGVAVALEIARQIKNNPLKSNIGVDIVFFDNEDNGAPDNAPNSDPKWWCLGSQYWAANKHIPNYSAYYGILLDMVGGKNTFFQKEGYSMQNATSIVELVWSTAAQLGYSKYFKNENGGSAIDDHVPVNEIAKIPMIDIISTDGSGFGSFWHTHDDNLSNVSKEHLKAVGQTVLQVIYNE